MPQDTAPTSRIVAWLALSLVLGCAGICGVLQSQVITMPLLPWSFVILSLTAFCVSFLLAWVLRILPGDGARWAIVVGGAVPLAIVAPPITFIAVFAGCVAVDLAGGARCILP